MRHVYLDIETTGDNYQHGDRIVEIGAVEVWHGALTERHFHVYLNPNKRSHPNAIERHGLSRSFLRAHNSVDWIDRLLFEFIRGARLYMRDAHFAIEFLNAEIYRLGDKPHDYVAAGKYLKISDLVESVHDVTDMLQVTTLGEDWSLAHASWWTHPNCPSACCVMRRVRPCCV